MENGTTAKCPQCGAPSRWLPGPPWGPELVPDYCVACDNRALDEAELDRVAAQVEAAARAGRFDCI